MLLDRALRQSFSHMLRNALKARYRKLPTASFVAREFNLLCPYGDPVSVETARRWICGHSIPVVYRLIVLKKWLNLDLNALEGFGDHLEGSFPRAVVDKSDALSREVFIELSDAVILSIERLIDQLNESGYKIK
jgi:hypothetical protein